MQSDDKTEAMRCLKINSRHKKEQIIFDNYADTAKRRLRKSNLKFQMVESTNVIDIMEHLDQLPYEVLVMVRCHKGFL